MDATASDSASLIMDCFQENLTDLEVILDFLEEYYRQNEGEKVDKLNEGTCEQYWAFNEPPIVKPALQPLLPAHDFLSPPGESTTVSLSEPNFVSTRQQRKAAGIGKKVRLFHFLFEMLEDPSMAHCVSWVPAAAGVFRFSSTNKDQVAALWGKRKGNKRPMTYQKMSRALRNYAHSGEIFKVKRKLTYRFSPKTLALLQRCHSGNL